MTPSSIDPDARLRYADDILQRAAQELTALLREAAAELRPFPPFPGAFFTFGVEVEADGVLDRDVGCVIVAEDGELKELQISLDADEPALAPADPVSMRDEQLVDLNLQPFDRLLYAYHGLRTISALLRESRASGDT